MQKEKLSPQENLAIFLSKYRAAIRANRISKSHLQKLKSQL